MVHIGAPVDTIQYGMRYFRLYFVWLSCACSNQMFWRYWVYWVCCHEGSGVYLRCFAAVLKPFSVICMLSWRFCSLSKMLCRCPKAMECIWCAVLKVPLSISGALQMSGSHWVYSICCPECFSSIRGLLQLSWSYWVYLVCCSEDSRVYLRCLADVQKVLSMSGVLSWKLEVYQICFADVLKIQESIWCAVLKAWSLLDVLCRSPEGPEVYLECFADVQK